MSNKERFIYEMMDTPTLAQHAQKCVVRMHTARQAIRQAQLLCDKEQETNIRSELHTDRNLHRQLTRMIKSRQMTMFD